MTFAHPFMANSVDTIKREMLDAIGAGNVDELFEQIPDAHRTARPLQLPPALRSEAELRRHLLSLLKKNEDCEANLSFLGGGCWQHHVPAIVDEIAGRSEFLTSVWGTASSDMGRNQAWFEFTSQLGELLELDMVGLPVYSWGCAAGNAIRMATRLNGRSEVVLPRIIDPERLAVIRSYCVPEGMPDHIAISQAGYVAESGRIDLDDLAARVSSKTAAIYVEVPNCLGVIETEVEAIAAIAHRYGAEFIVGVDPSSLGVLAAPGSYGADIVVGTTQPLGIHMHCGGGSGGFIATRDEERYAREYPTLMISIAETVVPGERAFGLPLMHQTSYGLREQGKDWTGNSVYLWAIANAVYMSALGPQGFAELGERIVSLSHYAASMLAIIPGVSVVFPSGFFKEFVLRFEGRSVAEVNTALRAQGIFGGHDLSADFPWLGQAALYAVTELHGTADIKRLADALSRIMKS
jgi:glycine dehydrogenase subunit 1